MNVLGKIRKSKKAFFAPIEKEVTKIDKDGNENVVITSYKIKFIDSASAFLASSLSSHVDNLAEGIHKIKCKNQDCFLEYGSAKDNLIKYKCLSCNKDYSNKIFEELKKKFKSTLKFSNNDMNKFILLLRKGVFYLCGYMDDWEKFKETRLPEKKNFIATQIWRILQMKITCKRKEFVKTLT